MNLRVIAYGVILALLAIFLNLIDYFHLIRLLPTEFYILVIALMFTALGVWIGHKIFNPTKKDKFTLNEKALESLGITNRELEVLHLIEEGYSNKEIADRLYISIHTVKSHISSLFDKMDVNRRTELVKKAKALQLLP